MFIITHLPGALHWPTILAGRKVTIQSGITIPAWILNFWPRTLALPATWLMKRDSFASANWQQRSYEPLVPARKSPDLSVPMLITYQKQNNQEYSLMETQDIHSSWCCQFYPCIKPDLKKTVYSVLFWLIIELTYRIALWQSAIRVPWETAEEEVVKSDWGIYCQTRSRAWPTLTTLF